MQRRTLIIGAGAVLAATAAGVFTFGGSKTGMTEIGVLNAQEAAAVDTSGVAEMAMGAPDAPVTVVEYASFTCPHCATFHLGPAQSLKTDYIDTGKVRLVYRDVFFDRPGLWASLIARCEPTRFFGIADMLYRQQRDWIGSGDPAMIVESLRKIGLAAGLTGTQIDACFADAEGAQALYAWFQKNAEADGINSTPSLVIDGTNHSNMAWPELKAIIDARLAQ